ncbi:MAG: HNH endonuclease [Gammaproteobacteria bacterium]|nr:HNH endonuclease [Gammaproteobacteria bacterium]
MNFKTHLTQIGKSPKTADNYSRAVLGVMSTWAIDAGLCAHSLDNIHSIAELIKIEDAIKNIPIYQERNTIGKNMYSCAFKAFIEYRKSESSEELEHDIENIIEDKTIADTEKPTFINARIGQGKYRRELIGHWEACALTGFNDTRFLVASHIKPWKDSNHEQRLDAYNGLLLLPNLDKVFDLGFISFEDSGKIKISSYLEELDILGVRPDMQIKLQDQHQEYIQYHRDVVFESNI